MNFLCVRRTWDPLEMINRRLSRLLDLEFEIENHELQDRPVARFPLVNVLQTASHYIVIAELPGIAAENIKLEVTEDTLFLSGDRIGPDGVSEETFRRQERWEGPWSREIEFPRRTNPDSVTAEMVDGVLTIRVAKAEEVKPRQVAILSQNAARKGD